jgi:putative ABC transport system permease protein
VGVVDNLPLSGSWSQYTTNYQSFLEKFPPADSEKQIEYQACVVAGDYFRALGIPLRAGRWFAAAPPGEESREAIVSDNFARMLWGDASPLGQRVNIGGRERHWVEIVGVVGNVRHRGLEMQPVPTLYTPFGRRQQWDGTLVVRSEQPLAPLGASIRQMVREMEPGVVVRNVRTLDDLFRTHTADSRFLALLLGAFAGLAVLLAMVGTYGVLAYAVTQQTREIGIRLALGAQPRAVLRAVVQRGMTLVVAGVVVGLLAAVGLSRYLRALLFEISPSDPLTYALGAAVLLLVALLACWLPARRAARTDPMVALRYE